MKPPKTKKAPAVPAMPGSPGIAASRIKRADYVSAFVRGLDVLRLFGHDTPRLTVSLAAERTGLSRAAARRFLLTLAEIGYVGMDGDSFELRPTALELGYSYLSTWSTPDLITPFLRAGVAAMNENVSFGVLDGDQAVYVARAEARRLVQSIVIHVGSRVPASLSAMGRVLLAHQPECAIEAVLAKPLPRLTAASVASPAQLRRILTDVAAKGWCLVSGEFEEGLMSVAVPVTGEGGRVVGAINVGVPTARASEDDMVTRYLPGLQKVGEEVSRAVTMSGRW